MTGTMNNARQLYLAQFQMSNDGTATGDPSSAWPGDLFAGGYLTAGQNLVDYANLLLAKGYLKGGDVIKLFNAPSAVFTAGVALGPPESLTGAGNSVSEGLPGLRRGSVECDLRCDPQLRLRPNTSRGNCSLRHERVHLDPERRQRGRLQIRPGYPCRLGRSWERNNISEPNRPQRWRWRGPRRYSKRG
jgi:hypothetical protein